MRWGRLLSLAADAYGSLFLIAAGGLAGGFVAGLIASLVAPAWLEVSRGAGWSLGVAIAVYGVSTGRLRFYGARWRTGQPWKGAVIAESTGPTNIAPRRNIPWTRTLTTLAFLSGLGAIVGGIASCSLIVLWSSLLMSPISQRALQWERVISGQLQQTATETLAAPLPSPAATSSLEVVLAPLSQSTWQIPLLLAATVTLIAALVGLGLGLYADRYERQAAAAPSPNSGDNR